MPTDSAHAKILNGARRRKFSAPEFTGSPALRSHPIRKLMPDFRAPASVGGARCRWQYPDSGIGDQFSLLAVIPFAAQEILPGGLAGKGKELWAAPCDRRSQTNPRTFS